MQRSDLNVKTTGAQPGSYKPPELSRTGIRRLGRIRSVENLDLSPSSSQISFFTGSAPSSPGTRKATILSPLTKYTSTNTLSSGAAKEFRWPVLAPQHVQASFGVQWKQQGSGASSANSSRRNSIAPIEADPKFLQLLANSLVLNSQADSLPATVEVKTNTPPENRDYIKNLPTIKGLDKVCSYQYQGYSRAHLEAFCKNIERERGVLGLRPFDSLGTSLTEEGLESKPKAAAMKSADWGAQASRIPKNQTLSKLVGVDFSVIEEAQIKSDQSELPTSILKLSKARITELEQAVINTETDQKVLEERRELEDGVLLFTGRPRGSQSTFKYKLIPDGSRQYDVYIEVAGKMEPLDVYDFIPDYDIAFLSFEIAVTDLGGEHKVTPFVVSDACDHRFHITKGQDRKGADIQVEGYKMEGGEPQKVMDEVIGLASEKLKEYIPELNRDIGRTENNPMIHHGAAFDFSGTDLQSCLPMVLIISKPFGALDEQYYIVENLNQLRSIIQEMKNSKYFINTNHFDELSDIRAESFTHYRRKISALSTDEPV